MPATFTPGYALLIGVSSSANEPRLNVPVAAAGIRAVAHVLADPAFGAYPANQVTALSDADATRAGILDALDALALSTGADSTVFLYFCGHANYGDDGDYSLITHDTHFQKRKVVSGSGVRQGELIAKLRAIKARRIFMIWDTCHSGELVPAYSVGGTPYIGAPLPAPTVAAFLSTGKGRIIVRSCREGQVAYSGSGDLTVFAQALVAGLQGNGTQNNRGSLSAFDLYRRLYLPVVEAVAAQYGTRQEPELLVLKGAQSFAVARYRGCKPEGECAPVPLPASTAFREISPAYSQAALEQMLPLPYQHLNADRSDLRPAVQHMPAPPRDQITVTMEHLNLHIANARRGDLAIRIRLQQLIAALSTALQLTPAEKLEAAQHVARRAEAAITVAMAITPDQQDVQYTLSRFRETAAVLGLSLPGVATTAEQIAAEIDQLVRR
ncbi:MAG: caspase family protein [Oscillochloris sp.]|nr:caspase family protein [Oscillochloris sp.]